jgi:hypothetical protein
MLHALPRKSLCFQWLPSIAGNSAQRGCNAVRALSKPIGFGKADLGLL